MGAPTESTARGLLRYAAARLKGAGVVEPEKEAELLITATAGVDRVSLFRDDPALAPHLAERIRSLVERRLTHEPLQYLLGQVDFLGLRIRVGPGVLIPRPETELLIEELVRHADKEQACRIVDMCTGSGCLALAAARALPEATVTGTDVSDEALAYARDNATRNDIRNVRFLKGHLYEPVKGERFHIILSNPPYVKTGDMEALQPEIRDWEPGEALDGGADGLDFYRRILSLAPAHLVKAGLVVLELGYDQAEEVSALAGASGFETLDVRKDFCGIERVMVLRLQDIRDS
jgi:release factor glutamine methyltransferase